MGKRKKTARPPRLFPAAIPESRFQKAILRRVHTSGDREFLLGLYALDADGTRRRKEELAEPEAKRLGRLAKSIAANRGAVQVPKLIILAVIVAAVIVFNLLFKNALLTRALVAGLEGVFVARSEVAGLDFRLLGGTIAIDRIAVADRDRPMRNLFELGRTKLAIDAFRLLEGNVIVRDLVCEDVRWDTERATSGTLAKAGAAKADEAEVEAEPAPGILGTVKGFVQGFDIEGLVDREMAALSSPKRIAGANAQLAATIDTWSSRVAKDHADLEKLAAQVEKIRSYDLSSVKTAMDAAELVDAIAAAAPAVQSLTKELTAVGGDIAAEARRIRAEQAVLKAAIAADAAALGAKLDLASAGGWKNLASTLASRVLETYLGSYAVWAIRAKDAAIALVQRRKAGEKKERPLGRGGRTVVFPGASQPGFLLENASFSVAERANLPRIEGSLRDLTTDPDLVGRPIEVSANAAAGLKALSLEALIDTRTGEPDGTRVSFTADNWNLGLSERLESLGIESLAGIASIRTELSLASGGVARGTGTVTVREIALGMKTADDPVAATVADALRSVPEALVDFTFAGGAGGLTDMTVRTNLDDAVSRKINEQARRLTADAKAKLRGELDARLAPQLARNAELAAALSGLQATSGEDLASAQAAAATLATVQKDLEARLKSALPLPKLGF
jgi:uncharacterized protein (TIGR03545 family)